MGLVDAVDSTVLNVKELTAYECIKLARQDQRQNP